VKGSVFEITRWLQLKVGAFTAAVAGATGAKRGLHDSNGQGDEENQREQSEHRVTKERRDTIVRERLLASALKRRTQLQV
jgi:hypothetical protein